MNILRYYPFPVDLDRCVGRWKTLNDLSNSECTPNEIEDFNIIIFRIATEKNELKTLTKHISCECKCKFDGRKCNSN